MGSERTLTPTIHCPSLPVNRLPDNLREPRALPHESQKDRVVILVPELGILGRLWGLLATYICLWGRFRLWCAHMYAFWSNLDTIYIT